MRSSDWSSDGCPSDLQAPACPHHRRVTARQDLESIFLAALAACHPSRVVPAQLPEPPRGRTFVLALGKAACGMARAVVENWEAPLSGLAVVPHGAAEPLERIECITAGHPVPDEASVAAARHLLRSEEHTSELQSLMRISYAVFCLKKKKQTTK